MPGASAPTTAQYAGVGVFVAIVLFVVLYYSRSFNSVFVTRANADATAGTGDAVTVLPGPVQALGLGPDDVAVLPTFTYRSHSPGRGNAKAPAVAADCCAVCLDELRDGALVRMLPSCKHYFHAGCVDVWLLSHATCPVCRGSPGPEKVRLGVASLSPPLPQLRRFGAASPEGGHRNRTFLEAAAAAAAAMSSPDLSGDGPPVPSSNSSNFTLLYIIIAVLVGVILYMAIRYGRSVLAEWRQLQAGGHGATSSGTGLGLSVDDIAALPTFMYRARAASASPSPLGGGGRRSGSKGRRAPGAVECVVCLQELEDGDVVRVLPACRHFFHGRCIDAWLCAHSSCPVCRAHPEPERARLMEGFLSLPLPQLRRCGVSPERPTASRVLADILARSPLRSNCSTNGSKEMNVSKSPSPRLQGSRSPSPTPPVYGSVDDRCSKSPPPGVSEIVVVPSNLPSPMRFSTSRQLSARSIGTLEGIEQDYSHQRSEQHGGASRDMLTLHPRVVVATAAEAPAEDSREDGRLCYCVMVACVSLLLFVVLASATNLGRACAITGAIALLLGLACWLAPSGDDPPARQAPAAAAVPRLVVHHRCACGLADAAIGALPTFAYKPPAAAKGGGGDDKARGSSVLCAVCLEDVQAGEMVRQLPACRHLFHVDCVDAWLRTHRTCPLCRCELSPRNVTARAAAVTVESSADALPPV
ncbi:hypothetical protein BAE44_0017716 [Dichanthelium oligosanthes]|uniref:RING-type E3 ubiquitin transferase n=1 Tax=Dichanthelium oligosanthes TaxID=888268 RepID=A0A1E5V8B2_9POAL|nr:hypothetical protein BAE44_0017716 [Dichanthelium oligosanthes]